MHKSFSPLVIAMFGCFFWTFCLSGLIGCTSSSSLAKPEFEPEKLSQSIRLLADSIAKDNYIGTQRMGRLPIDAPAYLRRQSLMAKASDADLKNLTYHSNPVVSLVAFEGLYERAAPEVPAIFDRLSQRTETIQYIRGDISMPMPMLEYAYVYVMGYPLPGESLPQEISPKSPKFHLSDARRGEIEALILAQRAQKE